MMKFTQAGEVAAVVLRNMLLGSNLASLTLAKKPRKMVEYVSENLFLYKMLNAKRGLPQKNVCDVLPANDVEAIRLGHLHSDQAWLSKAPSYTADIVSLCLMCRILKPKTVFEIGTLIGYTALHFALNTGDDARIYTLDLPKDDKIVPQLKTTLVDDAHISSYVNHRHYCFEQTEVASKISCLFGDSATFDFSPYHGRVDLFFIDGAHSYEYVRSDTLHALRCCHPGSVIAWHDFGRAGINGVSRWLVELLKKRELYSIPGGSLAFTVVQ